MVEARQSDGGLPEAYFGIAVFLLFSITAAQAVWSFIHFVNEPSSGELPSSPALFGLLAIVLAITIISIEVMFDLTGKGIFPTVSGLVIIVSMCLPWVGGFFQLHINNGLSPALGVIPGVVFLGRYFGFSKWNESLKKQGNAGISKRVLYAELAAMVVALSVAAVLLVVGMEQSIAFWIVALVLPFYLISWAMSVYGIRHDGDKEGPDGPSLLPKPHRPDWAKGN